MLGVISQVSMILDISLQKMNELGLQKVDVLHTGQACECLWRFVANCFI